VPLAIHLWNRRPGREVAVGSLRWLAAGANRRLRNLRLEQVLLLLLRAALLGVLAVAVAGPAWRLAKPARRGQVLVSPTLAGTGSLAAVRPTIDSLRRRGYSLRWLAPGFPLIKAADWRTDSAGRSLTDQTLTSADAWYWGRVQQAGATFVGQPLYVVTPAAQRGFGGTHGALPARLTWLTLPVRRAEQWLHRATATPDSLHLQVGQANENTLTFRKISVKKPAPGATLRLPNLPALRYDLAASQVASLQPIAADSGQPTPAAVPVAPATLRAWVYAPAAAAAEARYLRAALQAAAPGLPGPLALTVSATPPATNARLDWLFWLSEAPVPATWQAQVYQGLHLWQSAAGASRADTASLAAPTASLDAPFMLWRRATAHLSGTPLWADSHGRPVLTQQPAGAGTTYLFASHLLPTWSTLPASPALPALLLDVLAPAPTVASLAPHDQRRFDASQLPPRPAASQPALASQPVTYRLLDLRPWLVLAAGLLFALERWLAQRRASLSTT
jgi:hypothetical protein